MKKSFIFLFLIMSMSIAVATKTITTLNCISQDTDRYEFQIRFTDTWLVIGYQQATSLVFLNDKIFYESSNGRFKHELSRITGRLSTVDKETGIPQTSFVCANSNRQF